MQTAEHVAGYQVPQGNSETLYAVRDNGQVWTTGSIRETRVFDAKGRTWTRVNIAAPTDANFIGTYPLPADIARKAR